MKKHLLSILYLWLIIFAISPSINAQDIPFSTDDTHLTIWNGTEYVPFFINGTNLGVSVPGTFPGELAADRKEYARWFAGIKEAGFNCMRIYTLHYPRFYEVLDSFNRANAQDPLLFMQGIWLNEELPEHNNLYSMSDTFKIEINENINCLHGKNYIGHRYGKAYGTYTTDASKWCLAYIVGREIYPGEVLTTDKKNPESTHFSGDHFSISNASPTEVWITSQLDHLVAYENLTYNTQRPVSASSWPTLDPLHHSEEINRDEDTASVNLARIEIVDAPAGMFISYHAYPYYPDFVSYQSDYLEYFDEFGSNSYMGYLTDLKSHYPHYPLIIAEYGVPSSWGIAHYSTSSMNHGGFDETGQGSTNIRLLKTIENTNCGGGMQFAYIDEWFKQTWITNPVDYNPYDRIIWHNMTAAEQNFGLLVYSKASTLQSIKQFDKNAPITELKADGNYTYFELEIALKEPIDNPDEIWVAIDTYADSLGESHLSTGTKIPFRSEFALQITNHSANLYITEAYDTYGIWHGTSGEKQLHHSIASDNAPWYIVRWKNNEGHSDVQYIGSMQVNYDFQNASSKDAVTISQDKIDIKIPWSLLNVVAPNKLSVLHNYKDTRVSEDTITDGFNIGVYHKDQWFTTDKRFAWDQWDRINQSTLIESRKVAYDITKNQSTQFNISAIAFRDSYVFDNETYPVSVSGANGVLKNDFDLDGSAMIALLAEQPQNGKVDLNNDGSFTYYPNTNFNGIDSMSYFVFDQHSLSTPNLIIFNISGNSTDIDYSPKRNGYCISTFPNPVSSQLSIQTDTIFEELFLFNSAGQITKTIDQQTRTLKIDISNLASGIYLLVGKMEDRYYSKKIIKN